MATNTIVDKLDSCIEQHLDAMTNLSVGSKEMTTAINDLVKLYKFRIDEEKLDFDYEDKNDRIDLDKIRVENDKTFKENQLKLDEQKYELDKSNKSDQHKLDEKRLELDKGDRNEQRDLERKRLESETTYRNGQLELEARKVTLDETDKVERRDLDKQRLDYDKACGENQIKEQRKDRYFKLGIAAAELLLPLAAYTALAMLGYAREFDGVITSATLKRVTNDIKFRK